MWLRELLEVVLRHACSGLRPIALGDSDESDWESSL